MNKALLLSGAVALALSGGAFAKTTHHHRSSMNNDATASNQQFTESDCNTLTVDSARNACMRSIHADAGHEHHMATGGTSSSAEGTTSGGGTMMDKAKAKTKHMWHRAKDNLHRGESSNSTMQHNQGAAEQNQ